MIRAILAMLLLGGTAVAAQADNGVSKGALPPGWLTMQQVTQRLQSEGYLVRKIKLDDGTYKVKATGADNRKTKLEISPSSGTVLSSKTDDDD